MANKQQPFDEDGNLLCLDCHKPIIQDQFYLVVRQWDTVDSDAEQSTVDLARAITIERSKWLGENESKYETREGYHW